MCSFQWRIKSKIIGPLFQENSHFFLKKGTWILSLKIEHRKTLFYFCIIYDPFSSGETSRVPWYASWWRWSRYYYNMQERETVESTIFSIPFWNLSVHCVSVEHLRKEGGGMKVFCSSGMISTTRRFFCV